LTDTDLQTPFDEAAPVVPLAAPAHAMPRLGSGRARFGAAVLAAAALHLAGLVAFSLAIVPDGQGQAGFVDNAIGVTIVDARVLATRDDATQATAAAAVVASVAAVDGNMEPPRAESAADAMAALPTPAKVTPELLVVPQAAQAVDSRKPEPIEPDPPKQAIADTTPAPVEQTTAALPTPTGSVGGTDAQVTQPTDTPPKAGAAAASPGAMSAYARTLATALAQAAPPAARGVSGQLLVRLVVSTDGSIDGAAIAKSSGNARLDRSVVDAVERVRLPAPPVGMTDKQRTYEMPYTFR
jgi:TonB family protein